MGSGDFKLLVVAGVLLAVYFTGGLNGIFAAGGGAGVGTPAVIDQDANCRALGISSNVCGDPATVGYNAYDYASGTASSATTANVSIYNGNVRLRDAASYDITDTTGFATQVGNRLSVYAIDYNGGYYWGTQTDKPNGFSTFDVKGTATYDVPVTRSIQTVTGLDTTVYNNSGASGLTACAVTTDCDYRILYGANEENQLIWKLKNAEADSAYDFNGFVTSNWNNTLAAQVVGDNAGGSYSQVPCSQNVTGVANLTLGNNSLTWLACFQRNEPYRINEYKQLEITLNLKSGATAPVGATEGLGDGGSENGWCFNALDGAWFTAKNTLPAYGMFTDSETGANVGMEEVLTSPLGADAGWCLEAV